MLTTEYLTPKDIAQLLHVHEETVRRYIRMRQLPAVKLGGVYRVRREDLEKFLANRRTA